MKIMFDCVLHAMYISFLTIHCMFVKLAFIISFILFNVMNNSDFISISTCKQSFISSSINTFIIYKIWFNIKVHLFLFFITLKPTIIQVSSRSDILNVSLNTVFIWWIFYIVLFSIRKFFTYTLIIITLL